MKWDKKYNIGIKDVDEQHQQLLKAINAFKESISYNEKYEKFADTIKYVVNYTQIHFKTEEEIMERIGYPNIKSHKILHLELIESVKEILLKLKNKEPYKPIQLYYFLTDWLMNHIILEDLKIGIYLRTKKY